jgi:hypothetical protein
MQLKPMSLKQFIKAFAEKDNFSERALTELYNYYNTLDDEYHYQFDIDKMCYDWREFTPEKISYNFRLDVSPENIVEIQQRIEALEFIVIYLQESNSFLIKKYYNLG